MNSLIPAARASSMAYWIRGRSTKVMISFGIDLVAGRKRVPRPATGKMAFVTFFGFMIHPLIALAPTTTEASPTIRPKLAKLRQHKE
jgi:hypothetical protein